MNHRKSELIIDPSSGQLSASRLCLLVLILGYLPIMLVLEAVGIKMGMWAQFALITGSVAGAYGANSAARVWREGGGNVPNIPIRTAKPQGD